jgi:hypothetical protein
MPHTDVFKPHISADPFKRQLCGGMQWSVDQHNGHRIDALLSVLCQGFFID